MYEHLFVQIPCLFKHIFVGTCICNENFLLLMYIHSRQYLEIFNQFNFDFELLKSELELDQTAILIFFLTIISHNRFCTRNRIQFFNHGQILLDTSGKHAIPGFSLLGVLKLA